MKKTVLAVALSLITGSAVAADALSGDQFTVSGEIAVGGYYQTDRKEVNEEVNNFDKQKDEEFYNGGVTGFDIFADYENGNIVGKFGGEFDVENDYGTSDSTFTITDTWVGYKTGAGVVSAGYANDTALDAVDGAADQTIEFLWSPNDASDARQVVKFEGDKEGVKYGISYYGDRNYTDDSAEEERQPGYNGYLGYENDTFMVNFGYEDNDEDKGTTDKLYLVNGSVKLGSVGIGATFAEEEFADGKKVKMYNTSAGYTIDALYLAVGYVTIEDTREAVNFGGSYAFTDNVTALVDVAYHISDEGYSLGVGAEEGDIESFVKLAYAF
ncbi:MULTISPECIES: porin [Vibrio]|uniref:porin n=1 Tax=Vibrio TaxID=662 RepID=UPI00207558D9|nr:MULTISPECIES: porin [Vibrio]USD33407.1 porin [Vibrio sp. SCSIO 43186]USD46476.1 porin [Vibrio sp. SCSIO 43145]USD70531.1 porin [Vibrio sp. SCSIO 43139]USD95451.1 porin [Vibrio coralliilyticus]